jgi:DNA-binding PadR family transcriptional regulator
LPTSDSDRDRCTERSRLESRRLIEPLEAEDRRNPYRLTSLGEKALRARLASMQAIMRVGQRRLASA